MSILWNFFLIESTKTNIIWYRCTLISFYIGTLSYRDFRRPKNSFSFAEPLRDTLCLKKLPIYLFIYSHPKSTKSNIKGFPNSLEKIQRKTNKRNYVISLFISLAGRTPWLCAFFTNININWDFIDNSISIYYHHYPSRRRSQV